MLLNLESGIERKRGTLNTAAGNILECQESCAANMLTGGRKINGSKKNPKFGKTFSIRKKKHLWNNQGSSICYIQFHSRLKLICIKHPMPQYTYTKCLYKTLKHKSESVYNTNTDANLLLLSLSSSSIRRPSYRS